MYIGTRQEGIICFAPNGIYKRSFSPDLQTTEQNNETNALYYYNDTLWFSLGTNSLNMLDLKSNRIHTFPTQFGTTNVTNIRSILVYYRITRRSGQRAVPFQPDDPPVFTNGRSFESEKSE